MNNKVYLVSLLTIIVVFIIILGFVYSRENAINKALIYTVKDYNKDGYLITRLEVTRVNLNFDFQNLTLYWRVDLSGSIVMNPGDKVGYVLGIVLKIDSLTGKITKEYRAV